MPGVLYFMKGVGGGGGGGCQCLSCCPFFHSYVTLLVNFYVKVLHETFFDCSYLCNHKLDFLHIWYLYSSIFDNSFLSPWVGPGVNNWDLGIFIMSKFCIKPFIIAHISVITYQILFRFGS